MIRLALEHAAITGLVAGAKIASLRLPVASLVRMADRAASLVEGDAPAGDVEVRAIVERTRRAAFRASRIVPGARCLHRALAARVWLAGQGLHSRVVIGFRRREKLEGHAWLEVATEHGQILLFVEQEAGFRRMWSSAG